MAKMVMTMEQYINNPAGWGSATNATPKPNVESIYLDKLNTLEKQGEIKLNCVSVKDKHINYLYYKNEIYKIVDALESQQLNLF